MSIHCFGYEEDSDKNYVVAHHHRHSPLVSLISRDEELRVHLGQSEWVAALCV